MQRIGAAVAKWLGIGLLVGLATVAGAFGLAQTDYAKQRLVRWIEAEARGTDGSGVTIGAIDGLVPFNLTLRDLAIEDREGVWLTVDAARLALSFPDAVRGALVADTLALAGVSVKREPVEDPAAANAPLLPEALPELPIAAVVRDLRADRVDIAAPVLGVPLQLDIAGKAVLAPLGESTLDLTIRRTAPAPAETVLEARYAGGGKTARLTLNARESGPGVLAALAGMDVVPGLRLTLDVTNDTRLIGTLAAAVDGRPLGDTPLGRALGAEATLDARLTVEPNGDVAADDLRLQAAQLSLSGNAKLTGGAEQVDARLDYAVPDLAPASELAGAPVGGRLTGTVAAQGALAQPTIDLTYAARDLRYDMAAAATLDGSATVRDPFGAPTVDLRFTSRDLRYDTTAVATLDGNGTVRDLFGTPTADLHVNARDLRADETAVATLEGDATLRGPLSDPGVELRFDVRDLRHAESAIAKLAGTANAAKLLTRPEGRIDTTIAAANLDARVATAFVLDGETLRLSDLSVRERGATVSGALDIRLDDFLAAGRINGKFADLAPWSSLAGMALAGSLDLDARLATEQGRQNAKVEARAARLSVRPPDSDMITAGTLTLNADLTDVLGRPKGQAKLAMANGAAGALTVKSLDLTAEGDDAALKFRGDAALKLDRDIALSATGSVARDKDGERLTVTSLKGSYGPEAFALARPLDVKRQGAVTTVAPTSLTAGGGRIDLSGRLDAERVEAKVDIATLPLKLVRLFAPSLAVDGTLDGSVRVTGPAAGPEARIQLTADRLTLQDNSVANLPKLTVRADGLARGGRLTMKASIAGLPGQPFALDAETPIVLSAAPFAFDMPSDKPIKANLRGAADLALLSSIVPIGEARVAGRADIALGVQGTLAAPKASGTVTLADGRYENLLTGTLVDKIALRLVADGATATIETLSATDGGTGKLNGSGRVALNREGAGRAEARVKLDSFAALRLDEARATVSGDLTLAGTPDRWRLAGQTQIDRAELKVPDKLPGRVVDLDVVFVDGGGPRPDATAPGAGTPEAKPVEIDLEVAVDAPGRVFVRGRGLDSEWRGALKIAGTASDPQVTGTLSVVRGNLDLLGKTFALTRGTLSFYGTNVDNPDIDFLAETSTATLTAQVHMTGTVQQPTIELTSSPPYPQDEILARVLFGKGSGQISPLEAVQLAQAAASLTGTSTGPDITNFLRSATGLDVLRLEQGTGSSTTSGATLKVGKYVADNVFVSVNQGLTTEDTNVGVEVELTPNISVETSVGNTLGPKLGINYKIDY